ncbi:MAG: tRNA pseudouridine(55) synthase TruB, partial [Saprospiraceae bacterium]|nr:tRNA pseudouridine(55) synthase TruB [Saprospiraceae bacterium]
GTLDPLATGLLIICTGKFTKQIDEFQALEKQYTGTLKLGITTPSYDAETAVDATFPIEHINQELLDATRRKFIGAIQQYPPIFSAIKVNGQPLYKKARQGEIVEVEARNVRIDEFELTHVHLPNVDFSVRCSKGTYIRSLAHDFGKALNSGAYLTDLRRTHIGSYNVNDAWKLEQLIAFIQPH